MICKLVCEEQCAAWKIYKEGKQTQNFSYCVLYTCNCDSQDTDMRN